MSDWRTDLYIDAVMDAPDERRKGSRRLRPMVWPWNESPPEGGRRRSRRDRRAGR